jgi:hypothetical protein
VDVTTTTTTTSIIEHEKTGTLFHHEIQTKTKLIIKHLNKTIVHNGICCLLRKIKSKQKPNSSSNI